MTDQIQEAEPDIAFMKEFMAWYLANDSVGFASEVFALDGLPPAVGNALDATTAICIALTAAMRHPEWAQAVVSSAARLAAGDLWTNAADILVQCVPMEVQS